MLGSLLRVGRWLVGEQLAQKCAYKGTSESGEEAGFGSGSCEEYGLNGDSKQYSGEGNVWLHLWGFLMTIFKHGG